MKKTLYIALFGALGAILRFVIINNPGTFGFPLHTFIINIIGTLFLGFIFGFIKHHPNNKYNDLFDSIGIGLIGSFTTFSLFIRQIHELNILRFTMLSILYLLVCIIVGNIFAYIGYRLGARL